MKNPCRTYTRLLFLLALLLSAAGAARAQSGPYGNEWLVPGQPYYKLKTWRDGLYRLDYAYLSRLTGASGVAPSQLQLWRRGKEVAVYQGGNATTLDASTFLEFYGQRNDGALDKEYYKDPLDQANPYYSYFTDTASYFITWGSRAGKRMAQPTATGGTPHAWRLQNALKMQVEAYADEPIGFYTYLPWLQGGDGFFGGDNYYGVGSPLYSRNDSLLRAVATSASTPPRLEVVFKGNSDPTDGHNVTVSVVPPSGTARALGSFAFRDYLVRRGKFALQYGDIASNGQVTVSLLGVQPQYPIYSLYQFAYTRLTVPQQVVWFSDRQQVFFQNDSLLTGPATYDVPGVPATVAGFDVHDPWNVQRIAPGTAAAAGAARFVFPSATAAQTRNLLLSDESRPLTPGPARRVNFRTIDPAASNFVVVTHPKLQQPGGGSQNPARDYAAYRASAAGGRYDTLMVTMPLLYNQFFYGEPSALALRHFARWLGAGSPATQTKYLLLLGKGITPGSSTYDNDYHGSFRGVAAAATTRVRGDIGLDLVPTTSRSPSDMFFSNDWANGDYVPRFVTGRVIASTPQEAVNYLRKLKSYEAALVAPTLDAWHKNVLNLVGGTTAADFAEFRGYLDRYKFQMEHPLFGANVTTIQRVAGPPTVLPFNISAQVNAGLQFINYFGHGSPQYINYDLGNILDPSSGYANTGKYPIMVMNGCAVGACFFAQPTFGGDWLLAPEKGTIGLLSETGFSYAEFIHPEQDTLNRLLFNTPAWFGRPLAEAHREVIRRLQTTSYYQADFPRGAAQLMCEVWHGDPALRIFAPLKPDFVTSNANLSITPVAGGSTPVTGSSPRFVLNVGVSNPGRITRDSVEVRVTRTYTSAASGTTQKATYLYYRRAGSALTAFPQAFRRDTTYAIELPQLVDATGDNTFLVELDFRNRVPELDETNNTGTLQFSFLRSGLTVLAPREFAVANTTLPRLVAQSNNLNEPLRSYDVQIDSVSTFASPALQSFTKQANTVVDVKPLRALTPAAGRDSVVWYWRVRFSTPATGEDGSWVTSSFRVITGAVAGGWSQSHNGQFGRDQLQGVAVAAPGNKWSFAPQGQAVLLRTSGGGLPGSGPSFGASGGTIQTNPSQAPNLTSCGNVVPNLLAVVLDGTTLRRVAVPAPAGTTYGTCGSAGQSFYLFGSATTNPADSVNNNLNTNAGYRAQLSTFLDNVPDGAYVLLVSQNRLRFASPDLAALRQKLTTVLGSTLVSTLHNGDPWAIVARKQASGGTVVAEQGPDRSSATPAYSQTIALNATVTRPGTSGTIVSTLIGPAREWQSLFSQIKNPNPTGSYTLALVGVDGSGAETVLNPNVKVKTLSLSNVSASTYPYLRLRLALADTATRVPPQLRQWLLAFKGLPEGVVRRDLVTAAAPTAYDAATLAKQAQTPPGYISFPVKFDNVATDPFATRLKVQLSLYDASNNLAKYPDGTPVQTLITAPRDLGVGDSVLTIPASLLRLKVVGVFGTLTPVAVVNPQLQPEQYYFNNELRLPPITIADTNVPPTLDVAFDGRHILNGELVSPTPTVVIQLKDADRLRYVNKASYLSVYLQAPNQSTPTLITDASLLHFSYDSTSQAGSVAKLVYTPGTLPNGVYTLSVQGRDPAGTSAGSQQFSVKFEVVTASTITNVYPYPNPITSKAKFVFTVTGTALPRNMKIQILSLTGRVVREIFMGELGPLHIGNNITDYAWDGTDQYGDRLANGTYLYRVLLDDDGQFTRRETAGDRAFKNDWGKLVLLR